MLNDSRRSDHRDRRSPFPRARRPFDELLLAPVIDDSVLWDRREARLGDGDVGELELLMRVRVAIECEDASCRKRARSELVVHVLTIPGSVDFDGHRATRRDL